MRTGQDLMNGKYKNLTVGDLKKLLKKVDDETPIFYIDGACSGKAWELSNTQIEFHNDKLVLKT
jgi:hypothetical protein